MGVAVSPPTVRAVCSPRGAKVADLPIEQRTSFEIVINLQAAKAIGHEVPAGPVLRADHAVE